MRRFAAIATLLLLAFLPAGWASLWSWISELNSWYAGDLSGSSSVRVDWNGQSVEVVSPLSEVAPGKFGASATYVGEKNGVTIRAESSTQVWLPKLSEGK
ncbi:MAG: hypothetical protein BLITH_0105 [Brockia lithotrophica]|uniref:Uncharacterized protein n=1 Tax=Brockia lithotrophica TaxID=933949 RepID=A0A2T5G523_9BACL|nr:hypothetical protein [Brockia lithotrophica]PTQ51279.1 MAG: hypothetical protein BLITH_0105 [Brockia lithotrophica]